MAEALLHWRAGHSPRSRIRLSIHSQMPRFNVALYAVGSTVPSILKDVSGESAREDAELAAGRRLATNCAAASRPHWRWRKRATGAPPRAGCPCLGAGRPPRYWESSSRVLDAAVAPGAPKRPPSWWRRNFATILQPALEIGDGALVRLDLFSQCADRRTQRHYHLTYAAEVGIIVDGHARLLMTGALHGGTRSAGDLLVIGCADVVAREDIRRMIGGLVVG